MDINEYKKLYGTHGGQVKWKELPPIVLNPLFYDVWFKEYKNKMTLFEFLRTIQGDPAEEYAGNFYGERLEIVDDYELRKDIIKSMRKIYPQIQGMGRGRIDAEIYKQINDSPFKPIVFPDGETIHIGSEGVISYLGWGFTTEVFVFKTTPSFGPILNWINEHPLEVKQ